MKKIFIVLIICNLTFIKYSLAATALSSNDNVSSYLVNTFDVSGEESLPRGLTFNNDGSKMYVVGEDGDDVNEFDLSANFDVSSPTFVQKYSFMTPTQSSNLENRPTSVKFNNDGTKMFITGRGSNDLNEFILTTAYNISTAQHETQLPFDSTDNDINAFDFNNDGTILFITGTENELMHQFKMNVAFDLSEGVELIRTKDLPGLNDENNPSNGEDEPFNIEFNLDGTRMFVIGTKGNDVNQYSLSIAFNISTATLDGGLNIGNNPTGIAFSNSGLRMFITGTSSKSVREYHLPCPYNLFSGGCPSITKDSDRTGIAIAQIEIAKKTIDLSTDTALNRLKWIRRNKDRQNLTNLNMNINYTNQLLASLTKAVQVSAAKKEKKEKEEDVFYWSEGSIAVGRIGDTNISSTKKVNSDAITFGADKFTNKNGIKGLAFRVGRNDIDVGNSGSNLDTDTYNITYYATTPIEDDTKFLDTVFGVGKLSSDLLTVLDGKNLTADRTGEQIYGTIRIKDEIKRNNLTLIPSGRFDIGHTILGSYKESGTGAIDVKKQHIRSKKIRLGIAAVEDLSNDQYTFKRHGKLEYVADIDRYSNFKYNYVDDNSVNFDDRLKSGALHNINGEIGIDIIMPENFSIFIIYERNQALKKGHTDKIHIAIGYLPNKKTNFAFKIDGADDLKSNYIISKNINDFLIDFRLTNNLMRPEDYEEASVNLSRKF
tara:strand:+ start:2043 stop:4184 length:2142 start_codon:yes stop_codon:yes gene_type:complete